MERDSVAITVREARSFGIANNYISVIAGRTRAVHTHSRKCRNNRLRCSFAPRLKL